MNKLNGLSQVEEVYKNEYQKFQKKFRYRNIIEILQTIKGEDNIIEIKESLLAICQLMAYEVMELSGDACPLYQIREGDSLEDRLEKTPKYDLEKSRADSKRNQLRNPLEAYETFTELLSITKDFLESFYLFKREITQTIKSRIQKLEPLLIKYTIDRFAKVRDRFGQKGLINIIHKVKRFYKEKPDIIIGVASGGTEIALIYSLIFDQPEVGIVRYSHQKGCGNVSHFEEGSGREKKRDKEVKIPPVLLEQLHKKVNGKKVLIVDDFASSGKTLQKVSEKMKEYNPSEIITAAEKVFHESEVKRVYPIS